jgi:hypothetical protein
MKTAFVFAGAHKTATTALQQACGDHARELLELGMLFPCAVTGYKEVHINHTYLVRECFGLEASRRRRAARGVAAHCSDDLRALWEQMIRSGRNLLIVGEGICLLEVSELQELRSSLESAGYRVKPFFSVRSPDGYLRSVVQQRVKGQSLQLAPDYIPKLRLLGQLQKILATWPDTSLMTFEQACRSEDGPVGFYLRKLFPSIPSALVKAMGATRSNPSGSDQAVRLASHIQTLHPRSSVPKQLRARRKFILALFRRLAGEPFRLLPTDLEASSTLDQVVNQTIQINSILAERVEGFTPYTPAISYGKEPAAWTPEVFESLEALRHLCPDEWIETLDGYISAKRSLESCGLA